MRAVQILLSAAAASLTAAPATAAAGTDPLQFFAGKTEGSGTIKIILKNEYRTASTGHGRIGPDGSLSLVQRVDEDGKPPRERRWHIRQTGANRYSGTMSEASGPVTIDAIGGRYRFRFQMKGNLSVEQWLTPLAGGMAARNSMTVRRFGMTVGTGTGVIRKLVAR